MNINQAKALIPSGWPHAVKKAEDRKIICEDLLQETINQIQNKNRNPTKWELDGLIKAIEAIRFGTYSHAAMEVMSVFATQNDVSKVGDLWLAVTDDSSLKI